MRLFSIITICRNNLNELIGTFESIRSQSFKDFEWIVIDGNSSDGTKDWLKINHSNQKWISEPDKGIFDAMNKGIQFSEGKYLIFINSGDRFSDNMVLSNIHDILKIKEPSFIYGDSIDMDESGNEFYRKAKDFQFIKRGMITQHQAMLFNKIHFPDIIFEPEYKLTGDYALACDIIHKSGSENIIKVDFPICKFRMGGTNELFRFKALSEDFNIRRKILKLSLVESIILFSLHFAHTLIKKTIPSSRFIRHKKVIQQ